MKSRKILITGGAGFIGSAMVRHIIKNTKHSLLNIDALTYAGNLNSLSSVIDSSRYEFSHTNILDREKLTKIFDTYHPDAVMHLAAESHVDRSIDDPSAFIETNILGTYNLLEVSRSYYNKMDVVEKANFRFHHISTDEVYGDLDSSGGIFTEDTKYDPSSPYSASKASSDHLVRAWYRTFQLPTIITNCSNNYGPFHFPEKLIPHTILNALHGRSIPIYGNGQQVRDWLFVEDHAEALIEVLTKSNPGQTYNIGGHNEKKNIEVVQEICRLLDELITDKPMGISSFSQLITFVDDRPGHDLRYAIDASKIKNDLGWTPKESFESGLRKTVCWFLENREWWEKTLKSQYELKRVGKTNHVL